MHVFRIGRTESTPKSPKFSQKGVLLGQSGQILKFFIILHYRNRGTTLVYRLLSRDEKFLKHFLEWTQNYKDIAPNLFEDGEKLFNEDIT